MITRSLKVCRLGFGLAALLAPVVLASFASPLEAQQAYQQTNLVSNIPGLAANTDPNLRNPWGVSFAAASPFWVSDQVTGVSTLYNSAGVKQALTVTIPGGNPTGQVFNPTPDFALATGGKALFIFSTLGGSITGWNPASGTTAQVGGTHAGSVYTGLALGNPGSGNFLYAADARNGNVDVFNNTFTLTTLAGNFVDPNLPTGFAPYNVQNINGTLYVTYENRAQGGGVVNAFDLNGNFLRRISANASGGVLSDPWGLTLTPSTFGPFANTLLIGNKGDGHISAFDPLTGQFKGQLLDSFGNPIANTGLWGLTFGNGGNGGDPNTLYFAAGINNEVDGLFGAIRVVPEPGSMAMLAGLGVTGSLFAIQRLRRRRK